MEEARNGFTDDREQGPLKGVLLLRQAGSPDSQLLSYFHNRILDLKKTSNPIELRKNAI